MQVINWMERTARYIAHSASFHLVFSSASLVEVFGNREANRKRSSNLQFSFCNFHFSILFCVALCSLLFSLCSSATAQTIADKTVASVTNGARATPDLITYSHLVWQAPPQPRGGLPHPPHSKN